MVYKILVIDSSMNKDPFLLIYKFSYKNLFNKNFLYKVYKNLVNYLLLQYSDELNKSKTKKNIFNKCFAPNSFLLLNGFLTKFRVPCSGRANIIYYSKEYKKVVDSTIGGKTAVLLSFFNYDGVFIYNYKNVFLSKLKNNFFQYFIFFQDGIVFFKKNKITDSRSDEALIKSIFFNISSEHSFLKFEPDMILNSKIVNLNFIKYSQIINNFLFGIKNEKDRFSGKFGLGNSFERNNIRRLIFIDERLNNFLIKTKIVQKLKEPIYEFVKFDVNSLNCKELIKIKSELKKYKINRNIINELKDYLIQSVNILKNKNVKKYVKCFIDNKRFCPAYCIRYKINNQTNKNLNGNIKNELLIKTSRDFYIDKGFVKEFFKKIFYKNEIINHIIKKEDKYRKNIYESIIDKFLEKLCVLNKKEKKQIMLIDKYDGNFKIPDKVKELLEYNNKYEGLNKKLFIIRYKYREKILNNLGLCVFTIFSINLNKIKKILKKNNGYLANE